MKTNKWKEGGRTKRGRSVTSGTSVEDARARFARENKHIVITKVSR